MDVGKVVGRVGVMEEVASAFKISYHKHKLESYLRGEHIFPATLELDITSQCTRTCDDCPMSRGAGSHSLSMEFIENLFASLEGQTKGLLVTGGEPTMSPDFPNILKRARERGFSEIAIVTNGSFLDQEPVADALLAHASTIRVSLYDWGTKSCVGVEPVLKRIEWLRKRIDAQGSDLQVGASALTSKDRTAILPELAESVRSAGAHWIYFHPMCTGWNLGCPARVDQEGVLENVERYRRNLKNGFDAFISRYRYVETELDFSEYHAAHFLLVIGSDGVNYLGPEVKYQPHHKLADLNSARFNGFLRRKDRLERIRSVNSQSYGALHSRHRGVLYNDYIEKLKQDARPVSDETVSGTKARFRFPHIL
ncbi:MAG: radical SAM protein [Deltaproteobacteria bacterium]|nr:radical SAM protein [Deltaproteobacteria bacterium]